ncbi:response regulator [Vibrio lamellibrachiae]|uniref:response regulator transcription factor n=1 Tax=Vibrio lamellibrachiae TaxID=2910253 RepID=UPI003D12312E
MQDTRLPVYVVDDDESIRDSLTFLLEEHEYRVSSFVDGPSFLDGADIGQAGCVILDSRMPKMRGQQVHEYLLEQNSPLSVIYLTGHGDVPMAVDALQAGAVNFFQKPVKGADLTQAIEKGFLASQSQVDRLQSLLAYQSLTEREKDILRLIIDGKRNQKIADELCIAMRTVEVHRASLLKKFSAKTVAELAFIYGQLA